VDHFRKLGTRLPSRLGCGGQVCEASRAPKTHHNYLRIGAGASDAGQISAKGGYDKHLRQLRNVLMVNQIKFVEALERYFPQGTHLTVPKGGYFLWVKLPDGINALTLYRQALKFGISIAPGPIFSAQQRFQGYIRLNYGHVWNDKIENALVTLGELIQSQQAPN